VDGVTTVVVVATVASVVVGVGVVGTQDPHSSGQATFNDGTISQRFAKPLQALFSTSPLQVSMVVVVIVVIVVDVVMVQSWFST
jgi:hypothetical protein